MYTSCCVGISIQMSTSCGGLIWVEGWYHGRYGKFHVMIFLSHILHWPFPSIDFYIAKKIFELTNCENKSLRELTLFNLQIFLFRVWLQKYTNQCRSVQWRQKQFVKSTWKTLTFSYLPSYIHIWPRIQLLVYAQWSQRLYVQVQRKMMNKDMYQIVCQSK
jgi:hypothetical protein